MAAEVTAPALAQALEELADDLPKVGLLRDGWYVQTLRAAAARLRSAETRPQHALDVIRAELAWYRRDGYKTDSGLDLAEHLQSFLDRPVPGETPAEPSQSIVIHGWSLDTDPVGAGDVPAVAPVAPSQPDLMRLLEKIQQRMEYARRAQCFDEKHAARYFDALTGIDIDIAEALAPPPSRDREESR